MSRRRELPRRLVTIPPKSPMQWRMVCERGLFNVLRSLGSGGYTHIDVIRRDGQHRGAYRAPIQGIPSGYYDRPANYLEGAIYRATLFTLDVTVTQEKKYWAFSDFQLRRPYDSRGFFNSSRNWRNDNAWFPSEQVYANGVAAGLWPDWKEAARVDLSDIAFTLISSGAHSETLYYDNESAELLEEQK